MGGGTVFRGMARVVGVAAVGAAAVPSTGVHCHVHQPILKQQENLSAMLNLSHKEACDIKGLQAPVDLHLDEEDRDCCLVEKREETGSDIVLRQLAFSPPPSKEEVEEATRELQAALSLSIPASDEGLLSSREVNIDMSSQAPERRATDSLLFQAPNCLGALAAENGSVMKAFQLLQTNSKIQDVVKSLACDPAVWNAVLSNEKVQELTLEDPHDLHASFADEDSVQYENKGSDESREQNESLITQVHGLVLRSKVYYNYMKGKLLSIMDSMFGSAEKNIASKEVPSAKDKTVASCIMLAVAVLIMVVAKRTMINGCMDAHDQLSNGRRTFCSHPFPPFLFDNASKLTVIQSRCKQEIPYFMYIHVK